MPFGLCLTRHPSRLDTKHARIKEDLLALARDRQLAALQVMIEMLTDLHEHGPESRYVKKLKGVRLWELKSRARGGHKGGARIYIYPTGEGDFLVLNAEVKEGNAPGMAKLKEALQMVDAYHNGVPIVERRRA